MKKLMIALTLLSVSVMLLIAVGGGDAFAFVIPCTEEVAAHYPPILRSDLSACSVASDPKPEAGIAVESFAQSFGGTWTLQARTVHGIVVKANSRVHIDVARVGAKGGQGALVTLECSDASCSKPSVIAGSMLELGLADNRVVVTSQPPVVNQGMIKAAATTPAVPRYRFFEQGGVYVAIDERDRAQAAERKWDRVVLTERTLTYVSCKDGRIDRYLKSSPKSLIGSTPVEQFLKQTAVRM
jgi:hypothetical protein